MGMALGPLEGPLAWESENCEFEGWTPEGWTDPGAAVEAGIGIRAEVSVVIPVMSLLGQPAAGGVHPPDGALRDATAGDIIVALDILEFRPERRGRRSE